MPYDVKLPDIGEGIAEGEIVKWLVKAGDRVREDQPLVEVMTDKASVEIPSPRTGTISALLAEEGAMVPVGSVIVSIAVDGESTASAPARTAEGSRATGAGATAGSGGAAGATGPQSSSSLPQSAPPASATIQATPAVRALAKELGVALESVVGTGPGGRIVAEDVRRSGAAPTPAPTASAHAASGAASDSGAVTRVPLRGLRRRIAEHMRRSLSTAAQFTFVGECDMTGIVEHRASLKAKAEAAGVRLTYLAYVFRALPDALRQFPLLNASLDDDAHEILLKHEFHLGLATNTDDGLTVPIVHDADRLTLFGLAREIERLAQAARDHKLKVEELQGGTFTVTSTGAHGGVLATPILHHPQVAILGVHEVKKKPAVVDGQIVARDLANLSLSLDHRVVDGAVGADFLYALIARLEDPKRWLTEGDLA